MAQLIFDIARAPQAICQIVQEFVQELRQNQGRSGRRLLKAESTRGLLDFTASFPRPIPETRIASNPTLFTKTPPGNDKFPL